MGTASPDAPVVAAMRAMMSLAGDPVALFLLLLAALLGIAAIVLAYER